MAAGCSAGTVRDGNHGVGALSLLLLTFLLAPLAAFAQTHACVSPALAYSSGNEVLSSPVTVTYPAHGTASPAGQGSNPSGVGYKVDVATVTPSSSVIFGVLDSDTSEGVPWDDADGLLTDGSVKAFAIDVGTAPATYKITITFNSPVTGVRFAVTDLDYIQESALVQAFPTAIGGSAIAVADNLLSSPSSLPALALGSAHATNDAYVVDQTKVNAAGSGLYNVKASGGVSDRTGTVLFRYGDAQAVQRIEVTYSGSSAGIWIAGLQFADPANCASGGTVATCNEASLDAALSGGGVVNFACGPATITLTTTKTISVDTTVNGAGLITLDGNGAVRIFDVRPSATLTLNNLSLAHGTTSSTGGAVNVSSGALIADNVAFSHNTGGAGGGAIYALPCESGTCRNPTVTVSNSTFTSNSTGGTAGGAIFVGDTTFSVSDSTFAGNSSLYGGAIAIYGDTDATITRDTFSGNWSQGHNFSQGHGGAIAVEQANTLIISNSTFTGNQAKLNTDNSVTTGGAIQLYGPPANAVLDNLTVAGNSASGSAGGVFFNPSTTTMRNSIVAGNTGGNCGGPGGFVDGGNNLQFGDASCRGAVVADPLLSALASNGGPTQTMALGTGSPAIDAGNTATCAAVDQRGIGRPQGAACDIGAYEAVQTPATANYQGLWWNPSESGWGINFAHQGDVIFVTWFTYAADNQPQWYTVVAHKTADHVYSGNVSSFSGLPFNTVPYTANANVKTPAGSATVTFAADGKSATFNYTVNGITQTKAIVPQQFVPGVALPTCVWGAQPDLTLATNYQDLWWVTDGLESGWGINFTHQGNVIFATWFTYDVNGRGWWLFVVASQTAVQGVYSGLLKAAVGPPFSAQPFDPNAVVRTAVGNGTITVTDGNHARFDYTVNGVTQTKNLVRQVFAAPGTVCQ